MPFLQEGGSVESDYVSSPLPAARLIVEPDQVLFLKRGFETEAGRVREWMDRLAQRLRDVHRPGEDPCSKETATALSENGNAAMTAAWGYVVQLENVAEALGEVATQYGLTEDANAGRLGRGTR